MHDRSVCTVYRNCESFFNQDPCDDGTLCTTGDTCSGGTCSGNPVECEEDTPCTLHSCDALSGDCLATQLDQVACNDGDPCTEGDSCVQGICEAQETDCDDGDVCTDDLCLPVLACVYNQNSGPCEDGNLCTSDDTCFDGECITGPPTDCDDGSVCTADSCSPSEELHSHGNGRRL